MLPSSTAAAAAVGGGSGGGDVLLEEGLLRSDGGEEGYGDLDLPLDLSDPIGAASDIVARQVCVGGVNA